VRVATPVDANYVGLCASVTVDHTGAQINFKQGIGAGGVWPAFGVSF